MLASYRLLSERSRVRLAPGARSNSTTIVPVEGACVANESAIRRSIATKIRINLSAFVVLAMVMIANEAQMRISDEVRAFLAQPLFHGIS